MSELYLIRHAQASFGSDNYDQLSALGADQSRWLGDYFAGLGLTFDHLVVGDMQRHRQTMDGILKGMKEGMKEGPNEGMDATGSSYQVHTGLNEYNFKQLVAGFGRAFPEDELYRQILQQPTDKSAYYRLLRRVLSAWHDDKIPKPEETWQAFADRVVAAASLIRSLAEPGNRVLAVSSGGAISAFIGHVLSLSPEKVFDLNLQIKNTSISRFFFNRDKLNLSGFNAIPHLETVGRSQYITYG